MKSVMTLSVLLVAASMAAASVHITLDPPVDGIGRDGMPTKSVLVKATADAGEVITSLDIGFFGPLLQTWTRALNEDTGEYDLTKTPFGAKQVTVRDSRFIMVVNAPSPWTGELARGTTETEDLNDGAVIGSFLYGKGTFLGAMYEGFPNRQAFGISGDVTALDIAQIVMNDSDYNAGGVHMIADGAAKNGAGQTVGAHFDMIIGVPEPVSIGLLAIGGVAALIRRRRA